VLPGPTRMQPKACDTSRSHCRRHDKCSWSRRAPEAIPCRFQTIQPDPRLDDLHDGVHSPDVSCHRGIPQGPLNLPGQSPHLILMKWNIHDPTTRPVPLVIDPGSEKI